MNEIENDRHLNRQVTLPAWYWPLRVRLTTGACLALIVAAAGLAI